MVMMDNLLQFCINKELGFVTITYEQHVTYHNHMVIIDRLTPFCKIWLYAYRSLSMIASIKVNSLRIVCT